MMEELGTKAMELIEKLESISPMLTDTVLTAVQVDAASRLVAGLVCLAIAVVGLRMCRAKAWAFMIDDDAYGGEGWVVMSIFSFFLLAVATGFLFNVWNWAAMFYPELYLAKQVLGL